MRQRVNLFTVALAVALLALAPFAAVLAQEHQTADETVTLTGQLSTDQEGGYVIIEEESGDSIPLVSSNDLADYVGSMVKVTGTWNKDADGNKFFEVSRIERAE